ncbi:hypothetical protein DFH08DRAFT_953343 [Mycena albidolilacea]|uniref:Uncharacterized protein n=1 Tax=Mycena albidolilacea TaxID=1033008 RepID=A0AAD7AGJ3_9AGAR|nr:hypothetical protein DFH08DRAFT_953343 [Mycena albidolilacea]
MQGLLRECLHRHMVAVHEYVSGTAPHKRRSAARPSSLPAVDEPNLPVSPSSDYSDYTTDCWSTEGASPSPSSSTYSHFSLSPTSSSSCSDEDLFAFIPSPPPTDFSLPASPTSSNGWMWDAHFEAAFFPPTCEKSPIIECTPSPGLALQYPAQGMDFFAIGCDTFRLPSTASSSSNLCSTTRWCSSHLLPLRHRMDSRPSRPAASRMWYPPLLLWASGTVPCIEAVSIRQHTLYF